MDGHSALIDLSENWKVSMIQGGKVFKISAPQLAWGPFSVGDELILNRVDAEPDKIMICMAGTGGGGIRLSKPPKSGFCTLSQSAKKLGFMVDATKAVNPHVLDPNNVHRRDDRIILKLFGLNLREYEVPEPKTKAKEKTKPKAPAVPFKFKAGPTGPVPDALAVLNDAVKDGFISVEVSESGFVVANATIQMDGK